MPFDEKMRIAVSSWSLHRRLGTTHPHDLTTDAVPVAQETFGPAHVALLDLPGEIAAHDVHRLEICSFHLPSRDRAYLADLRASLQAAGVRLQTLLIEAGDLSDPATSARDAEWIGGWVGVAEELGAENARIIAGKQKPSDDALALAADGLNRIAAGAAGYSVKLVTENWFDLLSTPDLVHDLLDRTEGKVGLNGDFGNWTGPGKYDALARIFGRASICHAKASFGGGAMDEADYGRCVDVAEAAGYSGPYTLIFDSDAPGEWEGIARERGFIRDRLGGTAG
ncbi:MAG: sugar phosphate isomerase/epimerase [Rhizobiaceae bacterium]|nr:sugar phosphate isomerase/epimerase [Rhizobiaceae bacterium]